MLEQPLSQRLRAIRDARTVEGIEPAPEPALPHRTPLGRLLVEKGAVTEAEVEEALERQREDSRPLGQILLDMGAVTPQVLARTLTEQHGFDFSASLRRRLSPVEGTEPEDELPEAADDGPGRERYLVREAGHSEPLHVAESFLDAADAAFELIEERDLDALEIVRARDGELERLWSYRREDTEATAGFSPEAPFAS